MAVDTARALLLLSGAAMVCLGAALLAADPRRLANRLLAGLLAFRGAGLLLPQLSQDPAWMAAAIRMQPYFLLATIPLALAFAMAYPAPGPTASRWRVGWWALGAAVVLDLAYVLDHTLFHTVAPGAAAIPALQAAGQDLQYLDWGVLAAVGSAGFVLLGAIGLRFLLLYRRDPHSAQARPLLLVGTGLMVGALFDGTSRLVALTDLLDSMEGYPWLPWGWSIQLLPVLALVPGVLGLAVLASGRRQPRPLHGTETVALVLGSAAMAAGLVRLLIPPDSDAAGNPLVLVLLGASRLAMPLLIGYAFLVEDPRSQPLRRQQAVAWGAAAGAILVVAAVASAWNTGGVDPGSLSPMLLLSVVAAAAFAALAAGFTLRIGREPLPPSTERRMLLPEAQPHGGARFGRHR